MVAKNYWGRMCLAAIANAARIHKIPLEATPVTITGSLQDIVRAIGIACYDFGSANGFNDCWKHLDDTDVEFNEIIAEMAKLRFTVVGAGWQVSA